MLVHTSWFRSLLVVASTGGLALAAGCSDPAESGGGSGTGGGASTTASAGGGDGTGGGGGGDGGSGGAGGGAFGSPCGGLAGVVCPDGFFCDYADDTCGADDGAGHCVNIPLDCSGPQAQPTCGCDGTIHYNACLSNLYGVDTAASGCSAPAGTFPCGPSFCDLATELCSASPDGQSPGYGYFYCIDLPAGCGGAPTCGCLAGEPCGDACSGDQASGLTLTCPAG